MSYISKEDLQVLRTERLKPVIEAQFTDLARAQQSGMVFRCRLVRYSSLWYPAGVQLSRGSALSIGQKVFRVLDVFGGLDLTMASVAEIHTEQDSDQELWDEAYRRHPKDHTVDDPFGATGEARSDPYGYEEYAAKAFVDGAKWYREHGGRA